MEFYAGSEVARRSCKTMPLFDREASRPTYWLQPAWHRGAWQQSLEERRFDVENDRAVAATEMEGFTLIVPQRAVIASAKLTEISAVGLFDYYPNVTFRTKSTNFDSISGGAPDRQIHARVPDA